MSEMAVTHILARIKAATPESPIAVFRPAPNPSGLLDAVFAATSASRRLIRQGSPALLGVWHGAEMVPWAKYVLETAALKLVAAYQERVAADQAAEAA